MQRCYEWAAGFYVAGAIGIFLKQTAIMLVENVRLQSEIIGHIQEVFA
jgi:hypothetical protein